MHIYNIHEVVAMVRRLVSNGLALKHAVHLVSAAYGFSSDDIYCNIQLTDRE